MPATTRGAGSARRRRVENDNSSPLLDLPDALILHIAIQVPASSLANLACACRALAEEYVPAALPMRASQICGHPLRPREGEHPLAALREPLHVSAVVTPAGWRHRVR